MILPSQIGFVVPAPIPTEWTGPTTNLTHRWPMDNANVSGTTITDVVGSLHGTAGSAVTSGSGPVTQARVFIENSNSYITLPSCPVVSLASAWSFGYWIMMPDITATPGDGDPTMFNFYDGTKNVRGTTAVTAHSAGGWQAINEDGSGTISKETVAAALVNNTWAHMLFTFDGATTFTIYKNGSAVSSQSSTGSGQANANTLGARQDSGDRCFIGSLYQYVVYTKELSSAEATQLYNAN